MTLKLVHVLKNKYVCVYISIFVFLSFDVINKWERDVALW